MNDCKEKFMASQVVQIFPNKKMRDRLDKNFGYARYMYNKGLQIWNRLYGFGIKIKKYTVRNEYIKNIEKEKWEESYTNNIVETSIENVYSAWNLYFKGVVSGKPKFKSRFSARKSFRIYRKNESAIRVDKNRFKFVKSNGWIKMSDELRFNGIIKTVTVFKDAGKYFAAFSIQLDNPSSIQNRFNNKSGIVGIDVNIGKFVISTNRKVSYNKFNLPMKKLEYYSNKASYYDKQMAAMRNHAKRVHKRYSKEHESDYQYSPSLRYLSMQLKRKKCYNKIKNIRKDWMHNFTTLMCKYFKEIHIEDLDNKAMIRHSNLAKRLTSSCFGKFKEQLKYKSEWYGNNLILVPRNFPSTQICSECGYRKTKDSYGGKQTLHGDSIHCEHQNYYCYKCGAILDRDENAAKNLMMYK